MTTTDTDASASTSGPRSAVSTRSLLLAWLLLAAIFAAVQSASLSAPPLPGAAEAVHAPAAPHDWFPLRVHGIRALEDPPLPRSIAAATDRLLGPGALATRLPNALALLGMALIGWLWAERAWGGRTAFYAALAILTAAGPSLFTGSAIPEAQLALWLLLGLYCLLTGMESGRQGRFYVMWTALALATLTGGLAAPALFAAAAVPLLLLSGQWRRWRHLRPFSGPLLYLAITAPWQIAAGPAPAAIGHPAPDYGRMPLAAYWLGHLAWLFPWSLFLPAVLAAAWRTRRSWLSHLHRDAGQTVDFYLDHAAREDVAGYVERLKFRVRTSWLLGLYSAIILAFFSLSAGRAYSALPAWPSLLILTAAVVAGAEQGRGPDGTPFPVSTAWLSVAQGVFAVAGVAAGVVLGSSLWQSRSLPAVPDTGFVYAHPAAEGWRLSVSHLFDPAFASIAALRVPAALAALALLIGPATAWWLRIRGRHLPATVILAVTASFLLIAAQTARARLEPVLGSAELRPGRPPETGLLLLPARSSPVGAPDRAL